MMRVGVLFAVLLVGCSGTSSGNGTSSSSSSSGANGTGPKNCRLSSKSEQCECSVSDLTIDDEWSKTSACDSPPPGALACAHYASTEAVDSCYYRVPHCQEINRDFASCECGLRTDLGGASNTKTTCTGTVCCAFADNCMCTKLTGTSIQNTQFDRDCSYGNGRKVSACSVTDVRKTCESNLKTVPSCGGLTWKE